MGGRAGGGARGGGGVYATEKRLAEKYLGNIKNPKLKQELAAGLAAFDKEFGIPDNVTITTKDLGVDTLGDITMRKGKSRIQISSRYEDGRFSLKTAKHTMIHELTHSIDVTDTQVIGKRKNGRIRWEVKPEFKPIDRKLVGLYHSFKTNYYSGMGNARKIGAYALTNKHEFLADAVASYMTGTKTPHSTAAFKIAKMMKTK